MIEVSGQPSSFRQAWVELQLLDKWLLDIEEVEV